MDKILAIKNTTCLCWKCLQEKDNIHTIEIHEMGYGSQFDCTSTEIHLCEECYQESVTDNKELWSMEEIPCEFNKENGYEFTEYKFENEMLQYIKSLPIEGRQFVDNEFSSNKWQMEAQDWIDYELDILPHDQCREYGLFSPDEIKSYHEKFPVCKFVTNVIYNDDSKGSRCAFGAFGEYGQLCDEHNISSECYNCKLYSERTEPIEDMTDEEFYLWSVIMQGRLAELVYKQKLKNKK